MSQEISCTWCGISSSDLRSCSGCSQHYFCSDECQSWHCRREGEQQPLCYPFRVQHSKDENGRYLVATRDIEPGELIFEDTPVVVGPSSKSPPTCLNCFNILTEKRVDFEDYDDGEEDENRCQRCALPLCSNEICR